MTEVLTKNETMNSGDISNEEIDVLLENTDQKASKEEKPSSDPFNEIVKLDDRAIQIVMREIGNKEIAKALKSTDTAIQNKIFKNMTKRAATML